MLVFKLRCPDRPGIVARVATYVASHGGNLLEFNQFTNASGGTFFARLEVDVDAIDVTPESFVRGFGVLAESLRAQWKCREFPSLLPTAILVTKTSHCLHELLWRIDDGDIPVRVTSVIGNRTDCEAAARAAGLPFHHVPIPKEDKQAGFEKVAEIFEAEGVELGVLARYMQILPDWFVERYERRLINIHHSFLPAFVGANPYRQAYERGVKLIGATCHYVTADLDAGPIIEQTVKRVLHSHSPGDLRRLGRDCERIALARGVRYHALERTIVDGNRAVVFED